MKQTSKKISQILDKRKVSKMKWGLIIFFVVAGLAGLLYYPFISATSMLGSAGDYAALWDTPNITHTDETKITGNMSIHPSASITGQYPEADQVSLAGAYNIGDGTGLTDNNDLTTAYIALNDIPAAQTLVSNGLDRSMLTSADGSSVKLNNFSLNSGNDDGLLSEIRRLFRGYFQQHFVRGG